MNQLAREKNTNELKSIYEVDTGDACNCICSCGKDLRAKNKGKSKDKPLLPKQKNAYFAHKPGEIDCGETTIHLLAKEVLKQTKKLRIYYLAEEKDELVTKSKIIEFKIVETEKAYPNENEIRIRPDVTTIDENSIPLFVEFCVTHPVDKEKKEEIIKIGINTIEIYLDFIEFETIKKDDKPNFFEMQEFLENYPKTKCKWIYNSEQDDLVKKIIVLQEQKVIDELKTYEEKLKEYKIYYETYIERVNKYTWNERFNEFRNNDFNIIEEKSKELSICKVKLKEEELKLKNLTRHWSREFAHIKSA